MVKKRKYEKGITLVALVVTIVVLLILSGISLKLVLDKNGIVRQAGEAKSKYEQDEANSETKMREMSSYIKEQTRGSLPTESDGSSKPYWPDSSFKKVDGTNLDNGLVIEDNSGNQYVWVEVPVSLYNNNDYNSNGDKKPKSNEDFENIEYCLQQYGKNYSY